MTMNLVQPITPNVPTMQVQAALGATLNANVIPTQSSILATAPKQTSTNDSLLTPQTATALLSQQAVSINHISSTSKTDIGIVPGIAGATLSQLSAPGQSIKPGAGDFVKSLQQLSPNLGFNKLASPTVMTGSFGVTSSMNLVNNVTAQTGAVNSSLQSSSSALVKSGVLTGKETSIQSSGVIMAAAIFGTATVISVLKNSGSVTSTVGGNNDGIGNAIASGTYAASLSDKISSGVTGIANSIGGILSTGTKTLSSGITSFTNTVSGGLKSLISGFSSSSQNAFNIAEKSFGELKAGIPNQLGGIQNIPAYTPNKIVKLHQDVEIAKDELISAEKDLADAARTDRQTTSEDSRAALRVAENKVAAIEQRIKQLESSAVSGISSDLGMQNVNDIVSPINSSPSSANTGVNALPGGLGAFSGQVGSTISNALSAVKTILSEKSESLGNLIKNAESSIKTFVTNHNSSTNATEGLSNLKTGVSSFASKLESKAKDTATSITSNIAASLDSLGNIPGKIKSSILASDTFPDKAIINATLSKATTGADSRIPPATFTEFSPDTDPDEYQRAQVDAQQALTDLNAERDIKVLQRREYELSFLKTTDSQYMPALTQVNSEIEALDIKIKAAQVTYDRVSSYYA